MVALQLRVELLDLRLQLGDFVAEHPRAVGKRVRLFSKPGHDDTQFSGAGEPRAAWPKQARPPPPAARSAPGPPGKALRRSARPGGTTAARRGRRGWRRPPRAPP